MMNLALIKSGVLFGETDLALALESGDRVRYCMAHGSMHSTKTGPSHIERSRGLPCMRWPRLWPPLVVLAPVPVLLLPVGEQRERREQWRRVCQ
jgi:hypothetical protein